MPKHTEAFVHRYRLGFADTDAARIAYTGRFPAFALDAIEAWFRDRLGTDWYRLNVEEGIGTPFVHLSIDMRSPLTPRDELATTVLLAKAGRSSLEFHVAGRVDARLSYEGRFVCVFLNVAAHAAIPIPDNYRGLADAETALAASLRQTAH